MVNLLCHLMGYLPIFFQVAGYFTQDKLAGWPDMPLACQLAAARAPSPHAAPLTEMPPRVVPMAPACHLDAQALEAQHPGDSVPLRPTPVKACPPHAPAPSAQHPAHLDALAPTAQHPGSADKHQVQEMVRVILALPKVAPSDASDALAAAITHAHRPNLRPALEPRT